MTGILSNLETAMTTPDVLTTLAKLPPRCFATIPGSRGPRTIEIVRGVPGYIEINDFDGISDLESVDSAELLNARLDVPPNPEQVEAMVVGSMFGWHVPGADPDVVRDRNAARQAVP